MCFPFGLCGSQQSPMRLVRGCVPRIDHGAQPGVFAPGVRCSDCPCNVTSRAFRSVQIIEPELKKHFGQVLVIGREYGNKCVCEDELISCGLEHQASI